MNKPKPKKRAVKVTSIVATVFFVLAFSLLIFATLSRANPEMSLFGCRFYYVLTGSMEPEVKKGSFIVAREVPFNELEVGDTISFISHDPDIEGMINSHKIYSIDTNDEGVTEITTKGAANPTPDEYKVYRQDVKGKVVFASYPIGKVFEILSDRTVSFCVTVLPIAVIVLINLIDLFVIINTPEKGKDNKTTVENDDSADKLDKPKE
ncbi:MAG: signal peptidase I [Clostridia bacterium]|nr:signal peptidase I [Clostridia bacterium]